MKERMATAKEKQSNYDVEAARAAFEAKTDKKIFRFSALASKFAAESASASKREHSILDAIPMGQPILVGHHSEKRHRRDLDRAHNLIGKAIETREKSEHYAKRAALAANPQFISSDDPDAAQKYESEIQTLEAKREDLKTNYVVNPNVEWWQEGSKDWRRIELESLSRKIRDKKKRMAQIKETRESPDVDLTIGGVEIKTDKALNRLQIFFPGKPAQEVRSELKSYGFRWAPSEGAWQRHISNSAEYFAQKIVEKYYGPKKEEARA